MDWLHKFLFKESPASFFFFGKKDPLDSIKLNLKKEPFDSLLQQRCIYEMRIRFKGYNLSPWEFSSDEGMIDFFLIYFKIFKILLENIDIQLSPGGMFYCSTLIHQTMDCGVIEYYVLEPKI